MDNRPAGPVLISAPTGRDAALAAEVLGKVRIASLICVGPDRLFQAIGPNAGAILLAEEALSAAGIDQLQAKLDAQEPWSDLPVIFLTGGSIDERWQEPPAATRLKQVTSVTLLERPFRTVTLVATVQAALRARQRQWEVRDLIEQRNLAIADLQRAKEEMEAAHAAKDHFLATLSHELRTPLTPVLMCVSHHLKNPALDSELQEDLAMIHRNVQLEARLIDDLLDITRISRGKIELHLGTIDLHAVLRDALEVCTGEDTHRRQLLVSLESRACEHHVTGDHARLQQVFWNLVNNAIKFSPDKGKVSIRTANPRPGRILVEVKDEGIGIEPARISQLFGAFEQGERTITRRFGGLGLGLAISKSLVELHGGKIRGQSEGLGRGSVFTVELETCRPAAQSGQAPPASWLSSAKRLRILLVDDHQPTLGILTRLLSRVGHEVRPTSSVTEARQQLTEEKFDILISDLGLPDGSGMDIVRGLDGDKPVCIALSGFGMEEDIEECLEAGFDSHVTKPVDWQHLCDTINRLMAHNARG